MYSLSRLALLAALGALAPACALAQDIAPRVELQLNGSDRLGAAGGLFVPFVLGDGTMVFADGWLDYQDGGRVGGSIGGGLRQQVGDWVLGANGTFDFLHSEQGMNYQQVSLGLEALSEHWEFRVNGYLPLGTKANEVDAFSAARIAGNNFVINQGYEVALYAVDAEAGVRLPVFDADSPNALKLYAGAFANGSDRTETVFGGSLRTELTLQLDPQFIPGATIALGGGLRFDSTNELSGVAYVRFSAPIGGAPNPASTAPDPLYQRVVRDRLIHTSGGAYGPDEAAVSSTGSGRLLQISAASGSIADLNAQIAAAGDGAIILASGDIVADSAITLVANQMLVGGGGVVNLTAPDGQQVAWRNPGSRTVLYGGSNGAALMNARLAAPLEPDVLILADGSTVSTLGIVGGNNGIVASGVRDITIDNVQISNVAGNGIQLADVNGATITNSSVRNTALCTAATDCEFSTFNPGFVPNAAINAVGIQNLTVRNFDIADTTYGIFIAPVIDDSVYPALIPSSAEHISLSNVTVTNSLREGLLVVNANDVQIDNLHIDNSALDRSMDLLVLMTSQNITLSNSTLKGGINGLMLAHSSVLPGTNPENIQVSNLQISGSSRSGIFMNPSYNVAFKDVTISDVGHYGVYLYGDAWGFQGGPVRDISFDNVGVSGAGEAGVYLSGPVENIDGNIAFDGQTPAFSFDSSGWAGNSVTQNGGQVFSVCGIEIVNGAVPTLCN